MTDPYGQNPDGAAPQNPPAPTPPVYTPPAYPASYGAAPQPPYGAAAPQPPYGAPPQGAQYGAAYPVQPSPGAPPVYGYGGGYTPGPRTNPLAIASMVTSIVGLVFSFTWVLGLGAIAGVILGHISLGQIKRTGEAGRGMALAGVIVGWATIGLGVLLIVAMIVFWGLLGTASISSNYS